MTKVDSHLCHLQSPHRVVNVCFIIQGLVEGCWRNEPMVNPSHNACISCISCHSAQAAPQPTPDVWLTKNRVRKGKAKPKTTDRRFAARNTRWDLGSVPKQLSSVDFRGLLCSISTACWYSKSLIRQTTWSMFIQFWFEQILAQALQVL